MKPKSIRFTYDSDVDAAYLTLSRGKVLNSEEVEPGLVVDLGADDRVLGVEILRFARRFLTQSRAQAAKAAKKLAG